MINPLLDSKFLELLDKHNQRELYAKIVCLTLDELPVEEIQGKVSQGSLSIDGTSAVRRTCSLTIVSDRVNINEYYWSFTTKFKLYLGLKVPDYIRNQYAQTTTPWQDEHSDGIFLNGEVTYPYEAYPDIVWFPQGIFLITDFKVQINANSTDNIYITGKDKMALLNGEIGGNFPHATDLKYRNVEVVDDEGKIYGTNKEEEQTIEEIIREMIHKYGNEPFHNIIIKDLSNGLELLEYQGDNDIYLLKNVENGLFEHVLFDGDVIRYDAAGNAVKISEIPASQLDTLSSQYIAKRAKKIKGTNSPVDKTYYTVVKSSYGSLVGYRMTDLTYNEKELIVNAGDTITSALDKIIDMLSDYEYFYDLDGRFVFQKKLTYINTSWNSLVTSNIESDYQQIARSNLTNELSVMLDASISSKLEDEVYSESTKLVSQTQYSFIGGKTTTALGNTPNIMNIRNDYAIWGKKKANSAGIENKFHLRTAIDEKPEKYIAFDGTEYNSDDWDWRELIYQMGQDYLNHNHDDDYEVVLSRNNPDYKFGHTGYEQYYEDILGFWRYLYNPYPPTEDNYGESYTSLAEALTAYENTYVTTGNDDTLYWNRLVFEDPAALLFWFDFINGKGSELDKYSVKAIGDRTKVVNSDDIKAIYYGEIPNLIYISQEDYEELIQSNTVNDGYIYVLLPDALTDYFVISKKSKSAQDMLDSLLYQYAYCNESISITTIPIYHLEPNVKIQVFDEKSKINGEYVINKLNVTLNYNGTMSISATRAPIRLY